MQRAEAYFHAVLFALALAMIAYVTALGSHWPALPAPL